MLSDRIEKTTNVEYIIDTNKLVQFICEAIIDRQAKNVVIFNVEDQLTCGSRIILCNGSATRQVRAIAENVLYTLKKEHGELPLGVEGRGLDQWVIIDYGSVILHVFQPEMREYYNLDGLWAESPIIELSDLGIDIEEDDSESEEESSSYFHDL